MNKDYLIYKLSETVKETSRIDNELFKRYGVKRGLRNEDHSGVLVGLTNIGDVVGYERLPDGSGIKAIPGKLLYRGIEVSDLVHGVQAENRLGYEETAFLLLSGYSVRLARRPLKNGLVVAGCAAVLTVVTAVCMPSQAIWFGVLHLNAAAMLLTCLLRPLLQACPAGPGLAVCAALFALTNQLPYGYLGFEGLRLVRMPQALYSANLFWLGLPDLTKFSSADYFPLLPWLFLFWCGWFLARLWRPRAGRAPAALRPLAFVGRHTLAVYMAHQPVLYGALWLWHALPVTNC